MARIVSVGTVVVVILRVDALAKRVDLAGEKAVADATKTESPKANMIDKFMIML